MLDGTCCDVVNGFWPLPNATKDSFLEITEVLDRPLVFQALKVKGNL